VERYSEDIDPMLEEVNFNVRVVDELREDVFNVRGNEKRTSDGHQEDPGVEEGPEKENLMAPIAFKLVKDETGRELKEVGNGNVRTQGVDEGVDVEQDLDHESKEDTTIDKTRKPTGGKWIYVTGYNDNCVGHFVCNC
jgi:hypothetical protein